MCATIVHVCSYWSLFVLVFAWQEDGDGDGDGDGGGESSLIFIRHVTFLDLSSRFFTKSSRNIVHQQKLDDEIWYFGFGVRWGHTTSYITPTLISSASRLIYHLSFVGFNIGSTNDTILHNLITTDKVFHIPGKTDWLYLGLSFGSRQRLYPSLCSADNIAARCSYREEISEDMPFYLTIWCKWGKVAQYQKRGTPATREIISLLSSRYTHTLIGNSTFSHRVS